MKPTIYEVAKEAEVSTATVSHVINKTRFVSPELISKVEQAINKLGYKNKHSKNTLLKSEVKAISLLVPDITSRFYSVIAKTIEDELNKKGYQLLIQSYNESSERELEYLNFAVSYKKVEAMIIVPSFLKLSDLKHLIESEIPFIFVNGRVEDLDSFAVLSDNAEGTYLAAIHLLKYGHERIGLFLWTDKLSTSAEQIEGYKRALDENGLKFDKELILNANESEAGLNDILKKCLINNNALTAIICTNMKLTLVLLRFLAEHGLSCPQDLSVVGYDNYELGSIFQPALTSISQYPKEIAQVLLDNLFKLINGEKVQPGTIRIPVKLNVRDSTQIIGRGPFGEKSVYPDVLVLSESEIEKVLSGNYNAAIAFHYSGKAWMRLIELGIRDVFYKLGIKLISVTDAHFDANLQCKQLEGLLLQEPSIIISIPCDEVITASAYKKISDSNTKLILINNVPVGFKHGDYITCVSVNERENGHNAGKLLGLYFKNYFYKTKVGFIVHGAPFFATKQRDSAAEQVIVEEFKNIEIVVKENFLREDRVYNICREMVRSNSEIKGLYVSWDGPALEAMRALSDMDREDICIFTCDLDIEVAVNMAKGSMIKGISAQRPYEQGVAMAYAAANALLGKKVAPFIGIKPYVVTPRNLSKAWKEIIKEKEPDELLEALKK